jgi:hypothetical protein
MKTIYPRIRIFLFTQANQAGEDSRQRPTALGLQYWFVPIRERTLNMSQPCPDGFRRENNCRMSEISFYFTQQGRNLYLILERLAGEIMNWLPSRPVRFLKCNFLHSRLSHEIMSGLDELLLSLLMQMATTL